MNSKIEENPQQPVDSQNERDVAGWKTHCVEHHDHGNEASLWDAGRSDASRRCRDAAQKRAR